MIDRVSIEELQRVAQILRPTTVWGYPRKPNDDAHELAHWLVAAPNRRDLRHFGLGTNGNTDLDIADEEPRLMPLSKTNEEEEEASILGIGILSMADPEDAAGEMVEHNWYERLEYDPSVTSVGSPYNDPYYLKSFTSLIAEDGIEDVIVRLKAKSLWPCQIAWRKAVQEAEKANEHR